MLIGIREMSKSAAQTFTTKILRMVSLQAFRRLVRDVCVPLVRLQFGAPPSAKFTAGLKYLFGDDKVCPRFR
jgi:hypothetical protein